MRVRTSVALVVAAFFFALFVLVRSNVDGVRALFGLANVIGSNDESQLTLGGISELLGHVQMLLLGAAMIAAAAASEQIANSGSRLGRSCGANAPFAWAAVLVAGFAAYLIAGRSSVVDGRRYFFLLDDAMNSMRYARHFADGDGLVYNVGERVEGYTNFLWVLAMAAIHRLGAGPAAAPLWVLVLSWGSVGLTVALVIDITRAAGLGPTWGACAALLVACDQNTMTWANSGLETSALTAAVTACAWALVRRRDRAFAVALTLVTLLRADGVVLATALGLAFVFTRPDRRLAARLLAPAATLAAAHFLFRRSYYGYWFPNTYYLKMIGLGDRLHVGLGGYGLRLAVRYPLFLALAGACLWGTRRPRLLRAFAAIVFFQAGYSIYLGGDIFGHLRFFAPVIPLLYVCALQVGAAAVHDLPRSHALAAHALLVGCCPVLSPTGRLGQQNEGTRFFRASLDYARRLERNVPAGTLVTIYPAGTVPYYAFAGRYVDVYGKDDEHIAHLDRYEGVAIGHDKIDFGYVYNQRRPDVATVFTPCSLIEEYMRSDAAGRKAIRNRLPFLTQVAIFDIGTPAFERDYYPNRVDWAGRSEAAPDCVFVRAGSGLPVFWSASGPPP